MRIMLVSPAPIGALDITPQLGLCYIMAHLERNGYKDVHYVNYLNFKEKDFTRKLETIRPDIVGINTYTPSRADSYRCAQLSKKVLPNVKTVLGGVHVTFLPEQTIEHYPEVDFVCFGEGEQTMLDLVRTLDADGAVENVAGICYRKDGKAVKNNERHDTPPLDDLSFPVYFPYYTKVNGENMKSASMVTSRGCAAACNFCTVPAFWGRQRLRKPESVLKEMRWLIEEHGVEYIWFMDDTFTIEMEEAKGLMEAVIESRLNRKIKWRCATRVNCVSEELLGLMKEAGCHRISFGVESGSPEILKTVMKGTRLEQAVKACRLAREAGIVVETNFMVGNPGETQSTIEETKNFIKIAKPDEFNVSNAVYLFPGTPIYSMAKRRNLITDEVWLEDIQTVSYTEEHSQTQLSLWQLEIMLECSRHTSLANRFRYFGLIVKQLRLKKLVGTAFRTILAILFQALTTGEDKRKKGRTDITALRVMLREESLKARKPGQLTPIRHLDGLAAQRLSL